MAAAPRYAVAEADLATDGDTMVRLWSDTLGHPERRRAKFDWYYRANPAGAPRVLFLDHPLPSGSSERIGVLALAWRALLLQGQPHTFGMLIDFGVAAGHRTLYPALLLQAAMRDRHLAACGAFFGFPNENSEPVMRRLGYQEVGQMVRHVRVLRSLPYLPQRWPMPLRRLAAPLVDVLLALRWRGLSAPRPPLRVEWLDAPDVRFDALWAAQAQRAGIVGRRDREFLQWRFFSPGAGPHQLAALSHDQFGLLGYAVCQFERRQLHVRDLLLHPQHEHTLPALLSAVFAQARAQSKSSVVVNACLPRDLASRLHAAGLIAREHRPVLAQFAAEAPAAWRALEWYATEADVDV